MKRMISAVCLILWALPVAADPAKLSQLLRLDDFAAVVREDLLNSGADLGQDILPAKAAPQWKTRLSVLYDVELLRRGLNDSFINSMDARLSAEAIAFYDTQLGRNLVEGELRASEATLDEALDEAAQAEAENLPRARAAVLSALILANDVVELNVAGQMTTYVRLQQGMARGGLLDMTDAEILADTWSTEEDLRTETQRWAMGYMMLSYKALSNEDIAAYTAFSQTAAGRAVNQAMFDAYYGLYADMALVLGLALADMVGGEEL